MSAKTEAVRIVKAIGAELSVNYDRKVPVPDQIQEVELYTPAGLAWYATSCHTMVLRYPGKTIDWDDVLREVEKGTVPCDKGCEWDDGCDINRPEPEENMT